MTGSQLGGWWINSSTSTPWWSTGLLLKEKNYLCATRWSTAKSSLHLLNLCSSPNPLCGGGSRWHRAILLLTAGLLAASKTGRAGSRLFITSCLWNIDFVAPGLLTCVWEIFISGRMAAEGGHIVSLFHLFVCNNSMWISEPLEEVDILVLVIQWVSHPSNLMPSTVLTVTACS